MAFPTNTVLTASTILRLQTSLPNRTLPVIPVTVTAGVGSGATATAVLTGTVVSSVTVSTGGTLYTSALSVVFSGGGGTGATGTAVLTAGVVTSVNIINGGTGYSSAPTVAFVTTPGIGATSISVAAIVAPTGTAYTGTQTVIQQGDTLTFNSATPLSVVVAADVVLGATTVFITAPLTAALQAGNVAVSNGLLQLLGVDNLDFSVTDKEVSTRGFENGLFDDARKVMIGGAMPISGFYRVGDPTFLQIILPAALSSTELYFKVVYPDLTVRQGYAFLKGFKEQNKLDDIRRFSFELRAVGTFAFA